SLPSRWSVNKKYFLNRVLRSLLLPTGFQTPCYCEHSDAVTQPQTTASEILAIHPHRPWLPNAGAPPRGWPLRLKAPTLGNSARDFKTAADTHHRCGLWELLTEVDRVEIDRHPLVRREDIQYLLLIYDNEKARPACQKQTGGPSPRQTAHADDAIAMAAKADPDVLVVSGTSAVDSQLVIRRTDEEKLIC